MKRSIRTKISIEVDIDYVFKPSVEGGYDDKFGNHVPGDPASVDINSIRVVDKNKQLELSGWLSADELFEIEEDLLKEEEIT